MYFTNQLMLYSTRPSPTSLHLLLLFFCLILSCLISFLSYPSPPLSAFSLSGTAFHSSSNLTSGLHLLSVPITSHCSLPLYLAGWHLGNPVFVWVPRPCWTQPGSPVWSAPAHLAAAAGKWWGLVAMATGWWAHLSVCEWDGWMGQIRRCRVVDREEIWQKEIQQGQTRWETGEGRDRRGI